MLKTKSISNRVLILSLFLLFWLSGCTFEETTTQLLAVQQIELSSLSNEYPKEGFTCTGLTKNTRQNVFYVGNIGALTPNNAIRSSIEILSGDMKKRIGEIDISGVSETIGDVQGLTYDEDTDSLWFCSFSDNKVYHISLKGKYISDFHVDKPSGIAYDNNNGTLWILTYNHLLETNTNGNIIKKYKLRVKGQDQLYYADKNHIFFTAGLNYSKENYVYEFNLESHSVKKKYTLLDSFAIEGIWIQDEHMIILNDGYYHSAKDKRNIICYYELSD